MKPMKKEHFEELVQSIRDGGAHLRGKKVRGLRVDKIDPHSVAAIRSKLQLSQSQFAKVLDISVDTLQNWEQGRRQPTGPAKVLLRIAAKHPETLLEEVA